MAPTPYFCNLADMARSETAFERLGRLMDAAVSSRQFSSRNEILQAAGLSSGYMGRLEDRTGDKSEANISVESAEKIARVLGVTVAEVLGEEPHPAVLDAYPERAWAIQAARDLQLPEAAIRTVLSDNPGSDPGRWYWFLRIWAASEMIGDTTSRRPTPVLPSKRR